MSNQITHINPSMRALQRINEKYDQLGNQLNDFYSAQAHGDNPDSNAFMKMLEQRSIAQEAMQSQFKLYEKPIKTVLNETK